jgi:periplasmic divalent cation tolerance protein
MVESGRMDVLQVTITAESREQAGALAGALLERRLAACVQVVGPVESRYWWEGRLETSTEWLCVVKTTVERYDELEAAVRRTHTYDVPEILAVPVVRGSQAYLRWVDEETARVP